MISSPGGFFHLDDYGAGLQTKRLASSTRIADLRARAERQILREEEVAKVSVEASTVGGVVYLRAEILTRTSKSLEVSFEVPEEGQVLVAA